MASSQIRSVEKSPVDEKTSYELNEESVAQLDASTSRGSGGTSPTKRRLPYAWQLAMIFLTCMCTCKSASRAVGSRVLMQLP